MLSILIPTFNYSVYSLVLEIHKQCVANKIDFEIITIDDGSTHFFDENEKINTITNCSYEVLSSNIGRSRIRNLLAKKAKFNWLLFLDSDVLPKNQNFISTYLKQINSEEKIINGGIVYPEEKPAQNKMLRWVYGKKREAIDFKTRSKTPYLSSLTLNFLVHKTVMQQVSFNEDIPNLRHEDTLFSYNLMTKNIKIEHIDNPVFHYGMDDFEVAIKKEKESLFALKNLIDEKLIPSDYVKISRVIMKLKKFKFITLFALFHKVTASIFLKNLSSNHPSLFIFDLYRLGYLCKLENHKT